MTARRPPLFSSPLADVAAGVLVAWSLVAATSRIELSGGDRPLDDGGDGAALAPTPGPAQLGSLVESARRSGLEVTLQVERDVSAVPQPVGVALYRIVQESLTNVVRHAGPGAKATVTLTDAPDGGLAVEIADNGTGGNGTGGTGVGIVGMRERAEATGGALVAGARPQGGWVVRSE